MIEELKQDRGRGNKMTIEELKQGYAQIPWGKLLIEMGWEPHDTVTAARVVAEYAARKIEKMEAEAAFAARRIDKLEVELENLRCSLP